MRKPWLMRYGVPTVSTKKINDLLACKGQTGSQELNLQNQKPDMISNPRHMRILDHRLTPNRELSVNPSQVAN